MTSSLSDWLRAQPTLAGRAPALDLAGLPLDPVDLFTEWIRDAAARGAAEPHAATLATVDHAGIPDARTLILKDISELGWAFASTGQSRKAQQLASRPVAALNFWWQPVVRAVRLRGPVQEASKEESDADLAARSAEARKGLSPGEWVLWRIIPTRVEFWQGAVDRRHARVVYTAADDGWSVSTDGPL